MASVSQKPNGTYLIRVSCGMNSSGKQISRSRIFTPSKSNLSYQKLNKEIDAFISAFEDELKNENVMRKPEKITFADFVEVYYETKKPILAPTTFDFYKMIIETELLPKFGSMKLRDIRTYHVQQFIQYLATEKKRKDGVDGGIGASTVRRYTTVLRSILTLAYKLEYTENDVGSSRRIEFPKEAPTEIKVFSFEEVQEIINALDSEPVNIRAVVEIAIFTGMRRGEIVGLKWADIDFENRTISVKRSIYKLTKQKSQEKDPKSNSSYRTISIPEHLCKTLVQYRIHQDRHISFMGDAWHNLDYVFTEEDGLVMNPQTPTKQFSKFLKRHDIRHLKFHGLRHTSATMLLSSGCDIKTVSSRLGHADLETTGVYVHALESVDKRAAETFENFISKAKQSVPEETN